MALQQIQGRSSHALGLVPAFLEVSKIGMFILFVGKPSFYVHHGSSMEGRSVVQMDHMLT